MGWVSIQAVDWLRHARIAHKPVRMVAEVQLVYGPYVAECKVKSSVYRLILEVRVCRVCCVCVWSTLLSVPVLLPQQASSEHSMTGGAVWGCCCCCCCWPLLLLLAAAAWRTARACLWSPSLSAH
jgi:hypothetical protein